MLVTCNRNATEREGPQRPKEIVRSSGDSGEPAHSIGTWTKETPTDGFLNERERLLGLTCFGFGCLRTEFHRRQPIFGSFDTRLSLRQSSRRVLQLALGLSDEFTSRPLGSFSSHFGELQSFHGALTKGLGADFSLSGMILHAAKDLGRLIYEIERPSS
jgi:hypothetical protein